MQVFPDTVPLWISFCFLIAIGIALFLVSDLLRIAALKAMVRRPAPERLQLYGLVFYFAYTAYVLLLGSTGIFRQNTLPPRILLLTTLPLLLFYTLLIAKPLFRTLLQALPLAALVRVHSFRFIGVFFLVAAYYGQLPASFAWVAGCGDILVAASAFYVARYVQRERPHYRLLLVLWNIAGLADIVVVVLSAMALTRTAIIDGSRGVAFMTVFPFSMIPAFAPATIIFLHLLVFRKMRSLAAKNAFRDTPIKR